MTIAIIAQWGADCARAANEAGGPEPTDSDWDWLADQLGRRPTPSERAAFEAGYRAAAVGRERNGQVRS